MEKDRTGGNSRYQLRKAAGMYWILDMEQEGAPYRKPVPVNEMGAAIWKLLAQGYEEKKIAEILCGEYGIKEEETLADVLQFRKQLKEWGLT